MSMKPKVAKFSKKAEDRLRQLFLADPKDYWTTADGRKILYKDLTKAHLSNIIKDGYQNVNILAEAKKRRMKVPERLVDKLSAREILMWVETFASCSLSDNELGTKMIELWEKDVSQFMWQLEQFLRLTKKSKREYDPKRP